jgi:Flp pilus assembly protein TadD
LKLGSQDDPGFLDTVISKYRPDIIIDDGSHLAHHLIFSFETLFPRIPPYGIYIIEDLFMHYGASEKFHVGYSGVPLKDYFGTIATRRLSGHIAANENHGFAKYCQENIESISFIPGAIVVRKRARPPSGDELVRTARSIAEKTGLARHWYGVAGVILAKGGSLKEAEQATERALSIEPDVAQYLLRLGEIHERQGRIEDGIAVLSKATEVERRNFTAWERLGRLQTRTGDHNGAARSLHTATELNRRNPFLFYWLSQALQKTGDLPAAEEAANQAIQVAAGGPHVAEFTAHRDRLREQLQDASV